jgi:hypothetical protein
MGSPCDYLLGLALQIGALTHPRFFFSVICIRTISSALLMQAENYNMNISDT